jgi:hypothetical protein
VYYSITTFTYFYLAATNGCYLACADRKEPQAQWNGIAVPLGVTIDESSGMAMKENLESRKFTDLRICRICCY